MSLLVQFMFVLGLTASLYILISAMIRIIKRNSNEELEKKIKNLETKIDTLTTAQKSK